MLPRNPLRRALLLPRPSSRPILTPRFAHKDAQSKDSIKVEPNEYSKTGSDPEAAQKSSAFDPGSTRPEEQTNGSGKDPLDVSPANKDVSKTNTKDHGAHGSKAESGSGAEERQRSSGGSEGKGNKAGEGKRYD